MKKGILLFATGAPFYGTSAYHLALTIKEAANIPICLIHDDKAIAQLNEQELKIFDLKETVEQAMVNISGKPDGFIAKLYAYEVSPFEETIVMDVDTFWSKKKNPYDLFEELKSCDFTMISEGWTNTQNEGKLNPKYTFWAPLEDIVEAYLEEGGFFDGRLYQYRSEFFYFKKTEKIKLFFDTAIQVRRNLKVTAKTIGGQIPDELCFDIAGAITHTYPHKDNWTPIHWYWFHGRVSESTKGQILANNYAISLGGFNAPSELIKWYKAALNRAALLRGVSIRHTIGTKKEMVPGRKTI